MKKIYTLLACVTVALGANAQSFEQPQPFIQKTLPHAVGSNARLSSPDTTGIVNVVDFMPAFDLTSPTFYSYSGGGFLFGNNRSGNGFKEVAQGYENMNSIPVNILGVLLWVGGIESDLGSSATSKVVIKAYDMAANKAANTSGGTVGTTLNFPGPNTLKASADLLFTDLDTTDFNYVTFPVPAIIASTNFVIGFDVSTLAAGDTVGLVSDAQNDAQNIDFAYHKISSGKWFVSDNIFSTSGSGGLDNSIALWAVLEDATGVNEFFNGMKLTTYPNPAVNNVTIEYTLENNAKSVKLIVLDPAGRRVIDNNYNSQSAGNYKINFETSNLAAGTYFYSLNADGHNFTKQLIITK